MSDDSPGVPSGRIAWAEGEETRTSVRRCSKRSSSARSAHGRQLCGPPYALLIMIRHARRFRAGRLSRGSSRFRETSARATDHNFSTRIYRQAEPREPKVYRRAGENESRANRTAEFAHAHDSSPSTSAAIYRSLGGRLVNKSGARLMRILFGNKEKRETVYICIHIYIHM